MKYRGCRRIWSSFLCIGLILLSSCAETTESPTPPIAPPSTPDPVGGKMVSFAVHFGPEEEEDVLTRAVDSYSEEWGTNLENEVNQVRMVLYDGAVGLSDHERKVLYVFDYRIRSAKSPSSTGEWDTFEQYSVSASEKNHLYVRGGATPSPTQASFITFARVVDEAPYKLLMIVNPTKRGSGSTASALLDLYQITQVGQSLADFKAVATMDPADIENKTNCGPAAIYTDGAEQHGYFLMTNHQDLIDIPVSRLRETEQAANEDPVPVYVSRAVAKTTVRKGAVNLPVEPSGATISDLTWDLDIVNKKTYWTRRMAWLINTGGGKSSQKETYGHGGDNRKYQYAEDPNYSNWYVGKTQGELNDNFLYLKNNSITPVLSKPVGEYGSTNVAIGYSLENTLDETKKYTDVISRVLVRCVYTPPGMTAGTSYYIYNNMIIKAEDMSRYAAGTEVIPGVYINLAEAIDAAESEGKSLTNPSASFESNGIAYYHKGVNYYSVPVQHSGLQAAGYGEATYGYYGMVRNTHYKIVIDKIRGPGSPTIEEIENSYIATTIQINKWKNREQSNIIGRK